jgi:hypothetical protein
MEMKAKMSDAVIQKKEFEADHVEVDAKNCEVDAQR